MSAGLDSAGYKFKLVKVVIQHLEGVTLADRLFEPWSGAAKLERWVKF